MAEERRVDLRKEVFSKNQYPRTIDTEFSQLGVQTVAQEIASEFTVDEFFLRYNELFYDIPANGPVNSHEYLARTSGEYINFEEIDEEIQALRDEITTLRQENLQLQRDNIALDNGGTEIPELDLDNLDG